MITRSQRVYNWFYNNTRAQTTFSNKQEVLNLTKRSGKLQAYQAYLKVKAETLGPLIQKEYAIHKASLREGERPMAFIHFQAKVATEKLAKEEPDVLAEVKAYQDKEPSERLTSDEILQ